MSSPKSATHICPDRLHGALQCRLAEHWLLLQHAQRLRKRQRVLMRQQLLLRLLQRRPLLLQQLLLVVSHACAAATRAAAKLLQLCCSCFSLAEAGGARSSRTARPTNSTDVARWGVTPGGSSCSATCKCNKQQAGGSRFVQTLALMSM